MARANVTGHGRGIIEAFATHFTFKRRLLTRVGPQMCPVAAGLDEALLAVLTLVGFGLRVLPLMMIGQVGFCQETLFAEITLDVLILLFRVRLLLIHLLILGIFRILLILFRFHRLGSLLEVG